MSITITGGTIGALSTSGIAIAYGGGRGSISRNTTHEVTNTVQMGPRMRLEEVEINKDDLRDLVDYIRHRRKKLITTSLARNLDGCLDLVRFIFSFLDLSPFATLSTSAISSNYFEVEPEDYKF